MPAYGVKKIEAGVSTGDSKQRHESTRERFDRIAAQSGDLKLSRDDVDKFLTAFGKHIGADSLALDEDGTASITIDGETEMSLAYFPHLPGIVVGTPIANLPTDRTAFLKTALQANMSLDLTRGGVFAMLPGNDEILMCWLVSLVDADIERVDREIAEIVAFAKFWEAEFATALQREDAAKREDVDAKDQLLKSMTMRKTEA